VGLPAEEERWTSWHFFPVGKRNAANQPGPASTMLDSTLILEQMKAIWRAAFGIPLLGFACTGSHMLTTRAAMHRLLFSAAGATTGRSERRRQRQRGLAANFNADNFGRCGR